MDTFSLTMLLLAVVFAIADVVQNVMIQKLRKEKAAIELELAIHKSVRMAPMTEDVSSQNRLQQQINSNKKGMWVSG